MTPLETRQIVDFVYATKSQEATEKTYGAWHLVIANLNFEIAREAALMALRDEDIKIVEPKHILGKASRLKELAEIEIRKQSAIEAEPAKVTGVPMPKCKHDKGLLHCDPCCHDEAVKQGLKTGEFKPRKTLEQLLG